MGGLIYRRGLRIALYLKNDCLLPCVHISHSSSTCRRKAPEVVCGDVRRTGSIADCEEEQGRGHADWQKPAETPAET